MTQDALDQSFFNRPVLEVAYDLLGKFLVREIDGQTIALMINEVEAYDGSDDLACHGRFGKTPRTEPMFGEAGHFYVYLCYGVYWMLNVVTGPKNYPAAILIRGAGQFNGPGKLTKHLKIDKSFNGLLASPQNKLWLEDRGVEVSKKMITRTARIGVAYAGPEWAAVPYRFILKLK